MQRIAGAVELKDFKGDPAHAAQRVGALLGRMHHEGFSHRDLKTTNVMFDGSGRPHLIDLEGLNFCGDVLQGRAVADLEKKLSGI